MKPITAARARRRQGAVMVAILRAVVMGGPTIRRLAVLILMAGFAACTGPQHVLDPGGPAAVQIARLWWLMFWLATAVSLVVTGLLLYAVRRSRRRGAGEDIPPVNGQALVWTGAVIAPVIILFSLLVQSYRVGTDIYPPPAGADDALTIEVLGHQFWWEVRYPEAGVTTANEIHIPAGKPVRFLVRSPDVIHSFWIPNLQGKIDMIPGRVHTLWVQADEPGRFRGQCAEYCGMAHALMAFWVIALPDAEFQAWLDHRRTPRPEPAAIEVQRGRDVFFAAGCGDCHATRGVPLLPNLGEVGPDLSDLATRRTLAAGTLRNTRGALGGWIADPQRIKPGSRMPATHLPGDELQALLTYLQTLR